MSRRSTLLALLATTPIIACAAIALLVGPKPSPWWLIAVAVLPGTAIGLTAAFLPPTGKQTRRKDPTA